MSRCIRQSLSRSAARMNFLNKDFPRKMLSKLKKYSDLLVNASAVGKKERDPSVVDKKLLRKDLFVYDVVYNRDTELIKDARSIGASAVGGKRMLLYHFLELDLLSRCFGHKCFKVCSDVVLLL